MEDQDPRALRVAKLRALQANGDDPFKLERYERTHTAADITVECESLADTSVRAAGRITAIRLMGKAAFVHINDQSGKVQLYVRQDAIGETQFEQFKTLDIGDILGAEGTVFRTRTGEPSLHVSNYTLLAKCLRPPPIGKEQDGHRFSSLTDVETRYRQRYLDLLANPDVAYTLAQRSRIITAIRRFLDDRGYMEVETPMLQTVAGGAAARPFITHHNALDYNFKLRISLELYLKRLIVGGFEKVYEIGRVFRNEGVSTRHNPEFTLLELYEAYTDLDGMMDLVEEMYAAVCTALFGVPAFDMQLALHDGAHGSMRIDFSRRPWQRLSMLDGIAQYAGIAESELETLNSARTACERVGLSTEHETTVGGIIEKLHERFTQPHLLEPTFVTEFPAETSPLAKNHPTKPGLTRRFEVYLGGHELGNAFSEINDPLDQRARFELQAQQRVLGDQEAHPMDEDFLVALEYGMPPTGGLGIGIDRLAVVLTGAASVRDVILFPLMRPEHNHHTS